MTPQLDKTMFSLKTPCTDCPFLKEGGVRHGPLATLAYVNYFSTWPGTAFPCHRTVPKSLDRSDWTPWQDGQSMCVGGLLFAEKTHVQPAVVKLGQLLGYYAPADLVGIERVFDSAEDMLLANGAPKEAISGTNYTQQTFTYNIPGRDTMMWDVTLANAAAKAGHVIATVEIERAEMEAIASRNGFNEAKLPLVDPSQPGIGAPVTHEGQTFYILIDGTHRCVRALRDGVPFFCRLLNDEAAKRCQIAGRV